MTEKRRARTADEVLAEQLEDPEFRELWERYAPARALANALIRYRVDHDLTQAQLARKLGVSQPAVAKWETGEHNPTWETMLLLACKANIAISLTVATETTPIAPPGEALGPDTPGVSVLRVDPRKTGTHAMIVTRTPTPDEPGLVRI